jgi:hypothetical protein
MPSVRTDDRLLAEVLAIQVVVGNKSKLAAMLGIDRSTFLRFCSTGKAIDRTRARIRKGLMRYKNETTESHGKENASIGTVLTGNILEDMQTLRSLCNTVLTVLDGYEKLLAHRANNN